MTRRLVVEADGGSRGNPGPAGYGALVADAQTGEVLAERYDSLGTTTNNVAEYSGLVAGLRRLASWRRAPTSRSGWTPSWSSSRCRAAGRSRTRTCASWPPQARQAIGRAGPGLLYLGAAGPNTRADQLANQAMDAAPASLAGPGPVRGAAVPAVRPGRPRGAWRGAGSAAGGGRTGFCGRTGRVRGGFLSGRAGQGGEKVRGWGPARGTATTTLLLRHGQTPLSAERRFAGRGDVPADRPGPQQAEAAAARLAARGGIDVIVSSPLRRARRTAEAVAQATGAPWSPTRTWPRPTSASGKG